MITSRGVMGVVVGGRLKKEGIYVCMCVCVCVCVCVYNSFCCTAESNTTLQSNYTQIIIIIITLAPFRFVTVWGRKDKCTHPARC